MSAGGVGLALNYAAYAKCQLSRGDKGDTRVAHISVEISNDTSPSTAAQERWNVTVSRTRARASDVTRTAPDICIIFMQLRQPPAGAAERRQSASVSPQVRGLREKKKKQKKVKRERGRRVSPRGIRQSTPARESTSHFGAGTLRHAASVRYISSGITTLYLRSIPKISDV